MTLFRRLTLPTTCLTFAALLGAGCATAPLPKVTAGVEPGIPAIQIPLDSPEGQALLDPDRAIDFEPLLTNWVPQLKSHCGAASAVIVQNSLQPGAGYTQDNLFTPETARIITQDVVYRQGFTLDELREMIETRSGLRAERFHAGDGEGHHGFAEFVKALRANRRNPDDRLIVNFSRYRLDGRENGRGHFSPIADYNEKAGKVLLMDVNKEWPTVWLDAQAMYEAMNTTDPVSGLHRGWIVVKAGE